MLFRSVSQSRYFAARLVRVIDEMQAMEKGLRRRANDSIRMGGQADGTAAKIQLRLKIMEAQAEAITKAISVIKPLADLNKEKKKLETTIARLESQIDDGG